MSHNQIYSVPIITNTSCPVRVDVSSFHPVVFPSPCLSFPCQQTMSCSPGNNGPEDQSTAPLYSQVHLPSGKVELPLRSRTAQLSLRPRTVGVPSQVENVHRHGYFILPGSVIDLDDSIKIHIPYPTVHEKVKATPTLAMASQMGWLHPHSYHNKEELAGGILSPWASIPIAVPGYRHPGAGPARTVYNENDRSTFILIFHAKRIPLRQGSKWHDFSRAVLKVDKNQRSAYLGT